MARWNIDPDHSMAAFRVRHMMVANVRGQFNRLSGTAEFDQAAPTSFSLEVSIDAAGLYTGIAQRDEHLKSPDFFDVEAHPAITFKSTGFTAAGNGGKLAGDLTIHGVTRPVTMEAVISGPLKGPEDFGGETVLGISVTGKVNREDFGMTWNVPMDNDGIMVGREINVEMSIEADIEE
jgi:polyisoprenoid-binding protein YceI